MAIEPIQINTYSNNTTGFNPKVEKPDILNNQEIENKSSEKSEDKKTKESEEKDRILLSSEAQKFIYDPSDVHQKTDVANSNEEKIISQEKIQERAIEFRGIKQLEKRRALTPSEDERARDIKVEFERRGVPEREITKIAEKRLGELQSQAPELIRSLREQDITADQFAKFAKVNEALNKSNGFGVAEEDIAKEPKASELGSKFNAVISQNEGKKLTAKDLDFLQKLQTQIADALGFRLDARGTVGSDGIFA